MTTLTSIAITAMVVAHGVAATKSAVWLVQNSKVRKFYDEKRKERVSC
ncbi:hypothetical protein [Mechercharimyces sp. CAU 1602]|nr:hypothetical protein [Mechercharimyces sp. CAU 1602]MCS1350339.1 hypothetical protein [Mechercharimyces sp. CAU 1602]